MVGAETLDDAAVVRWPGSSALVVQTVDFFTPVVDDPYAYGCIAAANALSDVYAMGGRPVFALNVAAVPGDLPLDVLREIFRGGAETVVSAGAAILGGHTVTDPTLLYGMVVTGEVDEDELVTNAGAEAGDVLVLTKPLGTGLLYSAARSGDLDPAAYAAWVHSMRSLNAGAGHAMNWIGVNAATDVTGFGLLGHLMELACASGVSARLDHGALPALPAALEWAAGARLSGGAGRNRAYVGDRLVGDAPADRLRLMCDPQTSGGLLVAVPPARLDAFLDALIEQGVACQAILGELCAGPAGEVRL